MTVKEVLRGAAKRIRDKGWIQGAYALRAKNVGEETGKRSILAGSPCGAADDLAGTPVGPTDVIGALRQVGGSDPSVDKAKAKLREFLGVENLADWNDEPERTAEGVAKLLELVAA